MYKERSIEILFLNEYDEEEYKVIRGFVKYLINREKVSIVGITGIDENSLKLIEGVIFEVESSKVKEIRCEIHN